MILGMRNRLAIAVLALALFGPAASAQILVDDKATVRIETSLGVIVVDVNADRAPITVETFLQNVVNGFYDGTIFHRVVPGFLIQGGGYLPDLSAKPVTETVPNESGNGLLNRRGTIGMARGTEAHSATTQFYFNLQDNPELNPRPSRWGYTVFGEITEGLEVMDLIAAQPTGAGGEFERDLPIDTILIEHIELIREE